jgi:cytochrome d ubiquinol oxidase subunit II
VSKADAVAAVLWVGVTLYAVFGGADFGAGFWSLVARSGERDQRARNLIDWAIGPVWEANHVWLIFVFVVLWTSFSVAFEAIFSTGLASLLTPFFMGTVVGAVASGRVPVGNATGDAVSSWLNGVSLLTGALFLATGAYLAAVFLVSDAKRAGDADLERYFTTRALGAAIAAGAVAVADLVALHGDARHLFDRLTAEALPLVIISGLCGIAVPVLLARGERRGTRALAIGAVAAVVWGWGVAQFPYLLPETLTIKDGAAVGATLTEVLVVFGVAVVLVLPALGLLYTLTQRSVLEE